MPQTETLKTGGKIMTPNELREKLAEIKKNNGFLAISGYESSNGQIADITVQPLGADGYHRLVRESIEQVKAGDIVMPDGIDTDVWAEAIKSQLDSWEKTLNGGHGRKNRYQRERGKKELYTHADNGDVIYVKNIRIISKRILKQGQETVTNSRPLTIAKKELVTQTPVASYQGTFKLSDKDGKQRFRRIAFNRKKIEG